MNTKMYTHLKADISLRWLLTKETLFFDSDMYTSLSMVDTLAPALVVVCDENGDGNGDKQELIAHCCPLTWHL